MIAVTLDAVVWGGNPAVCVLVRKVANDASVLLAVPAPTKGRGSLAPVRGGWCIVRRSRLRRSLPMSSRRLNPLAAKNSNKVAVQCDPGIGTMQADQMRLRQALLNLMSNANKFTDRDP
jgi:hypothetical protein